MATESPPGCPRPASPACCRSRRRAPAWSTCRSTRCSSACRWRTSSRTAAPRLLLSGKARLATLEPGDADCPVLDEEESAALLDSSGRARPLGARSRRSRGLALHVGLDRAAQGGDAEPRQYVARRGQRRALSAPDARGPRPRRAAVELRLWPEPAALRPGPRAARSCRSTISPRAM